MVRWNRVAKLFAIVMVVDRAFHVSDPRNRKGLYAITCVGDHLDIVLRTGSDLAWSSGRGCMSGEGYPRGSRTVFVIAHIRTVGKSRGCPTGTGGGVGNCGIGCGRRHAGSPMMGWACLVAS